MKLIELILPSNIGQIISKNKCATYMKIDLFVW